MRRSNSGRRTSAGEIGLPSIKRATSQPSSGSNATTSGPTPTSNARLPAAYSTALSMPSSSVFAPPIRRTKPSPSMSTLKLRLVIPPPSSATFAVRPGQSLATAARPPSTRPGSYLLQWPRDGLAVHGSRARRAALKVHPARDQHRTPHPRRQGEGLGAVGRQRQAVHRLRRRHRRDERRPCSSPRDAGGAGAARARDPHLLPGRPVRVIPPARRAAVRGGADRRREEGSLLLDRRRGDRERGQDRALGDGPPRRHQLPWRVPRPPPAPAQPPPQRPAPQPGLPSPSG